jgi:hypothetical protein
VGAKTRMLVYAKSDAAAALRSIKGASDLDRAATQQFVQRLFPNVKLEEIGEGDLSYTDPRDGEIFAGCYSGVSIVAAEDFGIDNPSKLPSSFISAGEGGTVLLHAMHSVVDWFAFAQWSDGRLVRSLSLSPDNGIIEDIGERMPFEEPYWSGKHPVNDDPEEEDSEYPFPFHPLELGEAALEALFGYHIEGPVNPTLLDAESVPLIKFKRGVRSKWKFW